MLQTLKWSEDGELSQLDMEKVLSALEEQLIHHTHEDYHKDRWRTGSTLQE